MHGSRECMVIGNAKLLNCVFFWTGNIVICIKKYVANDMNEINSMQLYLHGQHSPEKECGESAHLVSKEFAGLVL